jgi:hydroxymethylglutaryl-CoA synthase
MCGPRENVYTMAANAALRLIRQYGVDPAQVGFLGLGTESSKDNSAGAVIVRGMLDEGLAALGLPPLGRALEVPELKHACLGGVYAMKSAVRYAQGDGGGKVAIVVAADVAEYERGSTGEQTQGAGAVAMLVEREPRLLGVDLARGGSASAYRGPDFRKPFSRHFTPGYAPGTRRLSDFPVFSGRYSTFAYLDEVAHAADEMLRRCGAEDLACYQDLRALFFHRPYRFMPIQAMSYLYARGLARDARRGAELEALCAAAKVEAEEVRAEVGRHPDLYAGVQKGGADMADPCPATSAAAKALRNTPAFSEFLAARMALGGEVAAQLGNLYSGALFAWMAAGLEEAQERKLKLARAPMAMVGYGSGDAAEAIPFSPVDGWEDAARRICTADALADPIDLTQAQYETIHDAEAGDPPWAPRREFLIRHVGTRHEREFQDLGVEYYEYVGR